MFRALAATAIAAAFGATAMAQSSTWTVDEVVSPLDDSVSILAKSDIANRAAVVVGCTKGMAFVGVQTNPFDFEIGAYRDVAWRVDSDELQRERWENVRKGGAVIYDDHAIALARRIRDASTRVVFLSGGETREFGVRGSTRMISRVLEHCGVE